MKKKFYLIRVLRYVGLLIPIGILAFYCLDAFSFSTIPKMTIPCGIDTIVDMIFIPVFIIMMFLPFLPDCIKFKLIDRFDKCREILKAFSILQIVRLILPNLISTIVFHLMGYEKTFFMSWQDIVAVILIIMFYFFIISDSDFMENKKICLIISSIFIFYIVLCGIISYVLCGYVEYNSLFRYLFPLLSMLYIELVFFKGNSVIYAFHFKNTHYKLDDDGVLYDQYRLINFIDEYGNSFEFVKVYTDEDNDDFAVSRNHSPLIRDITSELFVV